MNQPVLRQRFGFCLLGWGALLLAPSVQAQSITADPDPTGTVVNQYNNQYDITGGTHSGNNLYHSFEQFGLTAGEVANFITNPNTANILGRVTGGNASIIDGLLQVSGSNANLFLLNPSGILLGPNSALNLNGSFTATTADGLLLGADDIWTAGSDYSTLIGNPTGFIFSSDNPGTVVNSGTLAVNPGETLQLIGGQVITTGSLEAPDGAIQILAIEGEDLVRIAQSGQVLNLELATLPEQSSAPLPFTPLALPELLTGSGLSAAIGVTVNPDGSVNLTGSEVPIPTQPGIAAVSGELQGRQVDVLGHTVALLDAVIDASADFGGGQIRVGGDYLGSGPVPNAQVTYVDANSSLSADALKDGDGGRIIVWSDQTTRAYGNLSARGGLLGGEGGFIETSSAGYLDIPNAPDVSAPNGNGGSWLIDPYNITIGTGTESGFSPAVPPSSTLTAVANDVVINPATVVSFFDSSGGTLAISTGTGAPQDGDITINEELAFTTAGTLILDAAGNVLIDNSISSSGGPLNVTINAGGDIDFENTSGPGGVPYAITSNGGDIEFTAGGAITIGDVGGVVETSTLDSGTGNIDLTAVSGGIQQGSRGTLIATTGRITLDGIFSAAAGGVGVGSNGTISTTAGDISITGNGAGGIGLNGTVSTTSGNITISGTGNTTVGLGVFWTQPISSTTGNITINGNSPGGALPTAVLGTNDVTTSGSITVNGTGGDTAINLQSGTDLQGGNVSLIGRDSSVTAVNIDTPGTIGTGAAEITIQGTSTRGTSITATSDLNFSGDNLTLIGNQDIEVTNINGGGGEINITTDRFFRANGSVTTSGGSPITITHGGRGITPFIVGNAATNGTGGIISNGVDTISPTQSFLLDYTQGFINIITLGPNLDCVTSADPLCNRLPGSQNRPLPLNECPILRNETESNLAEAFSDAESDGCPSARDGGLE